MITLYNCFFITSLVYKPHCGIILSHAWPWQQVWLCLNLGSFPSPVVGLTCQLFNYVFDASLLMADVCKQSRYGLTLMLNHWLGSNLKAVCTPEMFLRVCEWWDLKLIPYSSPVVGITSQLLNPVFNASLLMVNTDVKLMQQCILDNSSLYRIYILAFYAFTDKGRRWIELAAKMRERRRDMEERSQRPNLNLGRLCALSVT